MIREDEMKKKEYTKIIALVVPHLKDPLISYTLLANNKEGREIFSKKFLSGIALWSQSIKPDLCSGFNQFN